MLKSASYDSNKGTGSGLALSKELVELHKGSISVQSEKDKGSIFTTYLKLGNTHFSEEQLHPGKKTYNSQVSSWIENYYVPKIQQILPVPQDEMPDRSNEDKETVLIVEEIMTYGSFYHNDFLLNTMLLQRIMVPKAFKKYLMNCPMW